MSRRRSHSPVPASPTPISGLVLEVSASDDVYPKPSTNPVELTPAGPAPLVLDLRAEDEQVTHPPGKPVPPPAAFSPAEREIIQKCLVEELKPADVAAQLGVPANTVSETLRRVRARIEQELASAGEKG
jgi:predicted DNA-binding protein (UPF0251 family)